MEHEDCDCALSDNVPHFNSVGDLNHKECGDCCRQQEAPNDEQIGRRVVGENLPEPPKPRRARPQQEPKLFVGHALDAHGRLVPAAAGGIKYIATGAVQL